MFDCLNPVIILRYRLGVLAYMFLFSFPRWMSVRIMPDDVWRRMLTACRPTVVSGYTFQIGEVGENRHVYMPSCTRRSPDGRTTGGAWGIVTTHAHTHGKDHGKLFSYPPPMVDEWACGAYTLVFSAKLTYLRRRSARAAHASGQDDGT